LSHTHKGGQTSQKVLHVCPPASKEAGFFYALGSSRPYNSAKNPVSAPISPSTAGLGSEKGPQQGRFSMMEGKPDDVLVEQAARGDGDSFTELCRRYYGSMVAIGHAILRDRHLAEDAAQQALAKAAVNLSKLRKADQFGSWLAAICRNEAKDLARGRRESPRGDEPPVVEGRTSPDESYNIVREALNQLPAEAKEVIYLRFYDGLSYDLISAALGISEQAINGRLRRAKKRLAQYLRRSGFDEVDL
jgi:RNA polymerase sigma-70 factor, ECF subfamily